MSELSHADTLNALLLPVLQQRMDSMGERESGAYNFYVQRLSRRNLLGGYELKLAQKLLDSRFPVSAIHEIGPGYGQLVFLLAMNGINALGIEIDQRRHATGAAMLAALLRAEPWLDGKCDMLEGGFPMATLEAAAPHAMALATNLVYTTTPQQQNVIVNAMRRYKMTIVDVDRLFEKRLTDEERKSAFELFARNGFHQPEPFLDLGADGRYYLFKPVR